MNTPIYDFVTAYLRSDTSRLHMPGHKGTGRLGVEERDITEIAGADVLYSAGGIIAESERNARRLFGTGCTVYSTEGSSLAIRAMLFLALERWKRAGKDGQRPALLAGRNAHKALLYAAALLDFDIRWLYPAETDLRSICSCQPDISEIDRQLSAMDPPPFAVYLTSPDYLGFSADVAAVAETCRSRGVPLLVDNAHGAYTHFLTPSRHPMDLGAYMCCDSAHKTLPCLTGGAYLHLSLEAAAELGAEANDAMALFGSTSPSYLILQSLDLCNAYLANDYPSRLAETVARIDALKTALCAKGVSILDTEPLKLTVDAAALGGTGEELASLLRRHGVEAEFADAQYLVLMFTPENRPEDLQRVETGLLCAAREGLHDGAGARNALRLRPLEQALTIRRAILAPHRIVPVEQSVGRICGQPSVSCPPAIPIAVSGERITQELLPLFLAYGVRELSVIDDGV